MESLKRSQKYCVKCQDKNPIRSFKCKKCGYEFPQKQKKELCSSQQSQLDQFLMKKTLPKDFLPSPYIDKKLKLSSTVVIIDNNVPIKKDFTLFTSLKSLYSMNQFIKINPENNSKYLEIIKDTNSKFLKIKLIKAADCINYSYDCISNMSNSTCLIGFISKETNQVYFSLTYLNRLSVSSNHIFTNNQYNHNTSYSIIIQLISKEPYDIFSIVTNNQLFCLCYNQATDELIQLFTITKAFPITLINTIYDSSVKLIKILLCDNNNQIFYYTFPLAVLDKPTKPKLLTVFENHFQNKITDLRFLDIKRNSMDNNTYFTACSRDGVVKILDINNTVIFKHKTYQTWITQICFDSRNDIMFFLTNYDDKIVGIKLSNKKEPIIKRINNTNNPQYALVSNVDDKLYYIDYLGCVYSIKTFLIEDMFKTSKSKKKNEYDPKKVYQLNDWEFTKKIRVLNLYDKEVNMCVIVQDALGALVFTHVNSK